MRFRVVSDRAVGSGTGGGPIRDQGLCSRAKLRRTLAVAADRRVLCEVVVVGSVIRSPRAVTLTVIAIVVVAAGSILAVAAATGALGHHRSAPTSVHCQAPALPGTDVSVGLVDMGSMMGRGPMMGGRGPLMSQHDWRHFRPGMMRVLVSPASIRHGIVSLTVTNAGYLRHEVVVLPLPAGQPVGSRVPGADGKVSEAGSLGEASASCAAGAGDGIAAGSTGWVTLRLRAGRYELICNLPGHYRAGMHAELDVT